MAKFLKGTGYLAVALSTWACSGDPPPVTDAGPTCDTVLELDWGYRDSGDFIAFDDGDKAEITLGFQGFRYIISTVRVRTTAALATLSFRIDVDGHDAYSQASVEELADGPDGQRHADELLVFFNDIPLPEIIGRNALISLHGEADGCEGNHAAEVMLVDEVSCIQLENGELECD
jgi:hypothetical protein